MENSDKFSMSEDEEDLEALRLAALKSLKKKNAAETADGQSSEYSNITESPQNYGNRPHRGYPNNRGRFYGQRGAKNGQFNSRIRSSNLISITPVSNDESNQTESKQINNGAKLTLPQDRYCAKDESTSKQDECSSKFDRYNDSGVSDDSESDDNKNEESEEEDASKLKRSDSLEALMQELDDEIQGKSKIKEGKSKIKEEKTAKVKTKSKKKKTLESESIASTSEEIRTTPTENNPDTVSVEAKVVLSEKTEKAPPEEHISKKMRRSPNERRNFQNHRRKLRSFPQQNYHPTPPFLPPVDFTQMPPTIAPLNQIFPGPGLILPPPVFFERPLSPLSISADTLQTQTMAPLSPRSAAFVLENRAIVEKRKRSPPRWSRSPSPRLRRSVSRSPRRSISPRRKSRSPRKRSLSPRRRSLSPRRINVKRDAVPASRNTKPHIKERLGVKPKPEVAKEDPPKEKTSEPKTSPKKDEKPLDPILEARKRKFESNEIKIKEGVIRLKPPENAESKEEEEQTRTDETQQLPESTTEDDVYEEEELKEDDLLADDALDLIAKPGDIFSDEDSGSENEGRFKTKEQPAVKPTVLSFSKLTNGAIKREMKDEPLPDSAKKRERRSGRRSRSPLSRRKQENRGTKDKQRDASKTKSQVSVKPERHPTDSPQRKFERKIEIKIKNPSKYEKKKVKFPKNDEKSDEKPSRKVEVAKQTVEKVDDDDDVLTEIVVEDDSAEDLNVSSSEGDLRAQLSKKRAEKLHRLVPAEEVPSRLLQNALQGVVFKKTKKTKSQDLTSSDGKLPIHLRLGIANNSDPFETKPKRKSRKRKTRDTQEQV